jgi:protoheme IX farnesyltransferase
MFPAGRMGLIYLLSALALGAVFIWRAARLWNSTSAARAFGLFKFSNQYLTLLFAAMALDALLGGR